MALQPTDILFLAIVIWIAVHLLDDDQGGGTRKFVFPTK